MTLPQPSSGPRAALSVLRSFHRHDLLPLLPDRIWRIEQGVMRTLTWTEQGHVTTLGIWGKGDIVGQPLTQIRPYQLECLTPVMAIDLGLATISQSPYWPSALLNHIWRSEELLSIVHQPATGDRLIQLLRWLAQRFGVPEAQGYRIDPMLTHQQVAEVLGSSRVTITRLLALLEAQGQIIRRRRLGRASVRAGRTIVIPAAAPLLRSP